MMKKLTAYIIILTANIILMAHAVLPHHHHQLKFCIEGSHCHHHNVTDPLDRSHDHDGEDTSNCILKQLIIFPSTQIKQECKCTDLSDGHFLYHDWHAVEINDDLQSLAILEATEIEFPLLTPVNYLLIYNSAGLRAPPAV